MYQSQKPKAEPVTGRTVWLRKGGAMSILHMIVEVGHTFPIFQSFPAESRAQKELRWEQQHKQLSVAQHEFIVNSLARIFAQSLGTWVDGKTVTLIDNSFTEFADAMTVQKVPLMMSHQTLLHSSGCVEFTISYILRGHMTVLTFCNLSPSEYERRVH